MTTTVTNRLIVHVMQARAAEWQLIGRSAAMVTWLSVYADQINETHHGKITFEWDGVSMRPHLYRSFDHINTESMLYLPDQQVTS